MNRKQLAFLSLLAEKAAEQSGGNAEASICFGRKKLLTVEKSCKMNRRRAAKAGDKETKKC